MRGLVIAVTLLMAPSMGLAEDWAKERFVLLRLPWQDHIGERAENEPNPLWERHPTLTVDEALERVLKPVAGLKSKKPWAGLEWLRFLAADDERLAQARKLLTPSQEGADPGPAWVNLYAVGRVPVGKRGTLALVGLLAQVGDEVDHASLGMPGSKAGEYEIADRPEVFLTEYYLLSLDGEGRLVDAMRMGHVHNTVAGDAGEKRSSGPVSLATDRTITASRTTWACFRDLRTIPPDANPEDMDAAPCWNLPEEPDFLFSERTRSQVRVDRSGRFRLVERDVLLDLAGRFKTPKDDSAWSILDCDRERSPECQPRVFICPGDAKGCAPLHVYEVDRKKRRVSVGNPEGGKPTHLTQTRDHKRLLCQGPRCSAGVYQRMAPWR